MNMLYNPLLWLILSLTAYAAVVNLVWAARSTADRSGLLAAVRHAADQPAWPLILGSLYFVGLPALAVALRLPGVLPANLGLPTDQGLAGAASAGGATPIPGLPAALLIAGGTLVILISIRRWFYISIAQPAPISWHTLDRSTAGQLVLKAIWYETHWAFVRACVLSLGNANPTLSVFLALAIVATEGWLNPDHRQLFGQLQPALQASQTAAVALQSAMVFLITRNSVYCLAAHLATAIALASVQFRPTAEPIEPYSSGLPDLQGIEPTIF